MPTDVEKMEFARRLNSIFDELNNPVRGRARTLEKITGVSNSATQKWLKGESIPRREPLRMIANKYGKSLEWLEYGEVHKSEVAVRYSDDPSVRVDQYVDIEVDLVCQQINGGTALVDSVPFKKSFLEEMDILPDQCCVVYHSGRSMEPTINDGDQMLVTRAVLGLINQKIYVFRVGEKNQTMRASTNVDGSVTLISDNDSPSFPDQRILQKDLDSLHIVGQVAWSGGKK